MLEQNTRVLFQKMLQGDQISLARLLSLVELEDPQVPALMELSASYAPRAYRIGITGLAGAGKSTLIDKLITIYRSHSEQVGVIAVDPSSLRSGGAVLGDRIRMQRHYLDNGVFIRSMATRGHYGGLSRAVKNAADLMAVSGKDIIFIETTGVGQTETEISGIGDLVVLLLMPGFGDSIQLMKAGLIEIADIIVVNKADLPGAEQLANEIRNELEYSRREAVPSVFMAQAAAGSGTLEIFNEIQKRRLKVQQP
jgi:LAO/AO transport system kinase